MHLEIVTPEEKLYAGEVISISLPGSNGSFQMLNNHAPIVSSLTTGNILIREASGTEQSFPIKGGVIEGNNNKLIVLAD